MPLKFILFLTTVFSFISLLPTAVANTELLDGFSTHLIEEGPMGPEKRERWENFKQKVGNMNFVNKVRFWIRFSLNEDDRLMCHYYRVYSSSFDCEAMIKRIFSWIEKAEEQGFSIVSRTEQLVQDFILLEQLQIEAAEKSSPEIINNL